MKRQLAMNGSSRLLSSVIHEIVTVKCAGDESVLGQCDSLSARGFQS